LLVSSYRNYLIKTKDRQNTYFCKNFNFMKQLSILLFLALFSYTVVADSLTIIITEIQGNTPPEDNIYFAGNLNGWNPGDPAYILVENTNGQPEITLEGNGGIEFKFTRGSWETVEGNENGQYLPNRTFTFGSADTLELTILSWEDTGGINHTAAENVSVMDEDFYMPQFDRYRRIWLYLPPNYDSTNDSYPVLYMHDGQNLFDAATSFAGEWEVDETLNELYEDGKPVPIVVGIDNGGDDRIDEYTPWPNQTYGGGDGDLYAQFIVETLKPYIDENYRTKPQREHTGVMGSSLGGLISHYIGIKYQNVFSKAGIFSPSYWFNDSVYDFTFITGKQEDMKIYMMGGSDESSGLVGQMMAMMDTLLASGYGEDEMALKVVQGGQHNEQLWREQFGEAYEWLFIDDASYINDYPAEAPIFVFYQNGQLAFKPSAKNQLQGMFEVQLFSITGQQVLNNKVTASNPVELPTGLHGVYIARIVGDGFVGSQKVFVPQE
jgi:predicted alpha/beta superfamily hydrolase